LAPVEPARRTVLVLAFCSWSACSTRMRSMARDRIGLPCHGSAGTAFSMYRKFSA
jgi:hypothetical protein